MAVLRIILADAEMELVPEEVAGHPAIRKIANAAGRKPSRLLLDANVHNAAMRKLPEGERRGRPDILQITLLQLLESPLNKTGGLEVGIHTRHGEWIRIRPDTRLPRGEARFQGLMAKVLAEGRSNDGDPLVWVEGEWSAAKVVKQFGIGNVVRLDPEGPATALEDIRSLADGDDLTLIIGGFAHGTFTPEWQAAAPSTASVWPELLTAWAVTAEVTAHWRA